MKKVSGEIFRDSPAGERRRDAPNTRTPLPFPLERISEIPQRPDDFRLLERIPFTKEGQIWPMQLSESVGDELPMVLLDTETTGLSADDESIIELGMVKVTYSPSTQRLVSILDVVSAYDDPGKPVPGVITELTGITTEMVRGQRIDDRLVASWLDDDPLVVAHNAAFDRPFFERRFAGQGDKAWACSANGIDWKALGFESRKLEYLLLRLGWFYEGHRAMTDCLAMAWLFHLVPEALGNLLSEADKRMVLVRSFGAPYEVKDFLKERGYRWHDGAQGANKHWWREIAESELTGEQTFLDDLYHRGAEHAHYDYKDARNRFKAL